MTAKYELTFEGLELILENKLYSYWCNIFNKNTEEAKECLGYASAIFDIMSDYFDKEQANIVWDREWKHEVELVRKKFEDEGKRKTKDCR